MDGPAAHHAAIGERRLLDGFVLRRLAKGRRLLAEIVGQRRVVPVHVLVVREVFGREPRPLLQHHHAETVLREFARQHATRCPGPNDDEIHRVGQFVMALRRQSRRS